MFNSGGQAPLTDKVKLTFAIRSYPKNQITNPVATIQITPYYRSGSAGRKSSNYQISNPDSIGTGKQNNHHYQITHHHQIPILSGQVIKSSNPDLRDRSPNH
jgi:hypothetical protein